MKLVVLSELIQELEVIQVIISILDILNSSALINRNNTNNGDPEMLQRDENAQDFLVLLGTLGARASGSHEILMPLFRQKDETVIIRISSSLRRISFCSVAFFHLQRISVKVEILQEVLF